MDWQLEQLLQSGAVSILDALGDAVSIQDFDLKVIYQNKRHMDLMGDQGGKFCFEGYQKRNSACSECHLLVALREGRVTRKICTTEHSRLGLIHVEIISSPLLDKNGTIVAGIEVVRDVTERTLLDDRYKAITCDLEEKTWKLMAANKELEAFSYTLSHDVRNYLSRISIAADSLSNEMTALDGSAAVFLVNSIIESVAAMDEMIDAILRLSAAGLGGIARDHVDMGCVAKEIALELRTVYPDHSVDLTVGTGLEVKGDRQLLKVMLRNLFGNAWKYTLPTPEARISFTAEEYGGKTIFVLRDNGVGFDMKESGRLFKPFSRLSNAVGIKGSGIGLATARRVILCHNGEIWAEGEPGKGSTFFFAIPLPSG